MYISFIKHIYIDYNRKYILDGERSLLLLNKSTAPHCSIIRSKSQEQFSNCTSNIKVLKKLYVYIQNK